MPFLPIKRWWFALLLFCSPDFVLAASSSQDALWSKAVAVAATNADWVPGLTVMRSEIVRKGETKSAHEMWTRSTAGSNGTVVAKLVKVLEDGKDVTEPEKKPTKDEKKKPGRQASNSPFDPGVQDHLSLKVTNSVRVISGHECAGYWFEARSTNGPTMRGLAWLDKASGIPAAVEQMTFDPLPDKHLKRMAITIHYEMAAEGVWRPSEVLMNCNASLLFMSVEIRSTTTFTEYWRNSPVEGGIKPKR